MEGTTKMLKPNERSDNDITKSRSDSNHWKCCCNIIIWIADLWHRAAGSIRIHRKNKLYEPRSCRLGRCEYTAASQRILWACFYQRYKTRLVWMFSGNLRDVMSKNRKWKVGWWKFGILLTSWVGRTAGWPPPQREWWFEDLPASVVGTLVACINSIKGLFMMRSQRAIITVSIRMINR